MPTISPFVLWLGQERLLLGPPKTAEIHRYSDPEHSVHAGIARQIVAARDPAQVVNSDGLWNAAERRGSQIEHIVLGLMFVSLRLNNLNGDR
jgi:hypothetical protein